MSQDDNLCQNEDCKHPKDKHPTECTERQSDGSKCSCTKFVKKKLKIKWSWKVDTKIAVILLIMGIILTSVSYFGSQNIPTQEEIAKAKNMTPIIEKSFRYESNSVFLGDKGTDFVPLFVANGEEITLTIQSQNVKKERESNDVFATVLDKKGEPITPEKDYRKRVDGIKNFKPFIANYSGFYSVYLENVGTSNENQGKVVFVVANITTTKLKIPENISTIPTNVEQFVMLFRVLDLMGPILIGTSVGMFAEVIRRYIVGR